MVRAADRMGDAWGAGLLGFAAGLAKQHAGDDATIEFSSAASRFNALGARCWNCGVGCWPCVTGQPSPRFIRPSKPVVCCAPGRPGMGAYVLASVSPGCRPRECVMRPNWRLTAGYRYPSPRSWTPRTYAQSRPGSLEPLIPRVAITCFGGYRITIDGQTSTLAQLRPQARWVLQILSLSPDHDHHREFLEDILWPGVDHSVACHRLQVAVSSVRTMFGQGELVIRRRGESYRLCLPSTASVDVRDFTAALSTAATLSAAEIWDAFWRASRRLTSTLAIYCRSSPGHST